MFAIKPGSSIAKMIEAEENAFRTKPWYTSRPPNVSDDVKEVFRKYSGIPSDRLDEHLHWIRDTVYQTQAWPLIGEWHFAHLALGTHPLYLEVLKRMKTGNETYLDIGCLFGQDIRRLVADGVPSRQCIGLDGRVDIWRLGFKLFDDELDLKSRFFHQSVDELTSRTSLSAHLNEQVDIINATSIFHQKEWRECEAIAHACVRFWNGKPGNLLVGRHFPQEHNDRQVRQTSPAHGYFVHNLESWKELWTKIGRESGIEFLAEGTMHLRSPRDSGIILDDNGDEPLLAYMVRRLN